MAQPKNKWDHGPKPLEPLTESYYMELLKKQKIRSDNDEFYDFGVFDSKGRMVGASSLMQVTRGVAQSAFLGYGIHNNYWGMGYGKEAVRAVIDIALRDIKLHRIEAGIEPKNLRSIKLAKSLGMRREGLKKRAIYLRNNWVDLIAFTLTSEDVGITFDSSIFASLPK